MFKIIQEATLPKLSQTSLYNKFNDSSNITSNLVNEIKTANSTAVKLDELSEILSLIKLNGDPVVKKAVNHLMDGDIVIIYNKSTSKIPTSLPFAVVGKNGMYKAYIFADRFMDNIKSTNEYAKLMAVLEAAYLALMLSRRPDDFIANRPLMLTLCNVYMLMATIPLEQKMYMKGDNLVKTMLYIISYFYKMIDGPIMNAETIPFKRLLDAHVEPSVITQIVNEVKALDNLSFLSVIELIKQLNPIRYKDLSTMYITYFTSSCGIPIIFALENISYLFLLITSANYKTSITAYGLNKTVSMPVKKAIMLLSSMNLK